NGQIVIGLINPNVIPSSAANLTTFLHILEVVAYATNIKSHSLSQLNNSYLTSFSFIVLYFSCKCSLCFSNISGCKYNEFIMLCFFLPCNPLAAQSFLGRSL